MAWRIDTRSDVPPSRQLVEAVLDALARGELKAEGKLPSVRAMAGLALVNPNTVGKAYRELVNLGVVEGRNGSGVFVTPTGPARARGLRHEATLEALRAAALEALRSGHAARDLRAVLEDILPGRRDKQRA